MAPNRATIPKEGRRITRSQINPTMQASTIPTATVRGGPTKATAANSESTSSVPTPTSYSSGSEYATPITSGAATPGTGVGMDLSTLSKTAASSSKIQIEIPISGKLKSRSKAPARVPNARKALRNSVYSLNPVSSSKRREVADSEDDYDSEDSPDLILARKLQEDEYNKAGATSSPPSITVAGPSRTRASRAAAVAVPAKSAPGNAASKWERAVWSNARFLDDEEVVDYEDEVDDDEDDMDDDEDDVDDDEDDVFIPKKRKSTVAPMGAKKKQKTTAAPKTSASKKGKGKAKMESSDEESDYLDSDAEYKVDVIAGAEGSEDEEESEDDGQPAQSAQPAASGQPAQPTQPAQAGANLQVNNALQRSYRRRVKTNRMHLERNHPDILTMWKDLAAMPKLTAGVAAQPESISRTLKQFQLEGLAWLMAMENTKWKGGLLGDEMGLGKTIQAVSLIMSDHPAKNPSLVLAPPVALMQWTSEIQNYTGGKLKAIVYHGTLSKSKHLTAKTLKEYDVVIMSYNSLESMFRKQEKGFKRKDGMHKAKSMIHHTQWHRVILDEAHCIKTRTTMTAKACFALRAKYRWCLSGTPLQNRIGEFYSLIRFLKIRPFADYFCYDCPCAKIEWTMGVDGDQCSFCGHHAMRHVSVFNQELLNPIQRWGNTGAGAEAFQKLRQLTNHIMLRRLKKDHTDSMELPVKEIIVDRQFYSEAENDFASSIMTSGQRQFDTYVAQGVLLNNYANIFGLIMQMRQVANHPDLILKKDSEGGQNVLVCCICDEPAEEAIRSGCKHDFCRSCAKAYLNSTEEPDCPRCHIPLVIDLEQPDMEQDEALVKKSSIINRIRMENWTSSTKIELLVHDLYRLRSKNVSHKSIVFSQFTTMLQLLEWRLRRAGITTVMLDGSMTPAQRQASIDHFMNNADVECFLVSLKAGGVALNLTEASRVFIVDPWWNPAAEWQSADRCHRIGQTRPCVITRLCIEDSVESRMVLLQEKKTKMINSTINSDDAAMDSLTSEDLQFLFRGN